MRLYIGLASLLVLGATPNMGLPVDVPGTTPWVTEMQDLETAKTIIDGHDHSPGKGAPIPVAGISIQSNLPFNGNAPTGMGYGGLADGGAGPSSALAFWSDGIDLWYEDGNGNKVQVTKGGSINANISVSGTVNLNVNRLQFIPTFISTNPYSVLATGTSYYVANPGASVVDLPAAAALSNFLVVVTNQTTGNITVSPAGSDTIANGGAWTLAANSVLRLVSNGSANWSLE